MVQKMVQNILQDIHALSVFYTRKYGGGTSKFGQINGSNVRQDSENFKKGNDKWSSD